MDMIQSNEQINSGIHFPYAYHRVSSYDPNMCSTARFTPPYPSHENDVESNYENVIMIPCSNTDSEKIRNVHENSLSTSTEVQGSYSIDAESPDTDYVRSATDQGASIFNGQRIHQVTSTTASFRTISVEQIDDGNGRYIHQISSAAETSIESPSGHIILHRSPNGHIYQNYYVNQDEHATEMVELVQIKNSHGLPPVEYNYQPKMPNNGELMEHLSDTAFVAMIPEQGSELLPESYGQIANNHSEANLNLHGKDQQRILLESTMSPLLAAVNDITQRDAELQSYLNQSTDTPIEATPQQIYSDYSKSSKSFNDLKQDDDVGDYLLVADKPVQSRARASLPTNYLYFCKSKLEGEVPLVYAKKEIPLRTKFGPFEGEPRFITEEMVDVLRIQTVRTYPILLLEETRILDITNENTSNWMRFIRMANTFTDQNLLLLEEAGKLYFKSCRIIKPKEELRVGYSDQYAEHYGVRTLTPTERESEEIFHRDNPWLCYECNHRFPTSNEMQSHLSVHEIEEDAQLESKKKLNTRKKKKPVKRMMEVRKNSSRCCYCFKVFMTSVSLKKHVAQHLAEKRSFKGSAKILSSNVCHKKFLSDEKLKTHRLLHIKNELKLYSCCHCDQGFSTQTALDIHENYHTNRRFKCVFCPETFKHVPDFKSHVSNHAVNGIYACHLCKKKYREYYLVRKHIRVFHPAVKHSCNECGRQFINVNFLRRHKVCHSEKREFLCSECGKQFKRKDKLREHILRMHTGNRKTSKNKQIFANKQTNDISRYLELSPKQPKDPPNDFKEFAYKCNECMIGFKRRGMLVNHIAKRHPGVNIDSVPELNQPIIKSQSIFLCQYCNKVYKSNGKRKIHILKNHPGEELPPSARSQPEPSKVNVQKIGNVKTEPQRCQWCYKQYATRNRLLYHYRKEQKIKDKTIILSLFCTSTTAGIISVDSDSMSDCRIISPQYHQSSLQKSNLTATKPNLAVFPSDNIAKLKINDSITTSSKQNSMVIATTTGISTNTSSNKVQLDNVKISPMQDSNHTPSCSNNLGVQQPKFNEANKNCDMNGSISSSSSSSSNGINGFDLPNGSGGQGSPSRSQLGLKLKSHTPAIRKQSPLQCPLCPYTSDNANILEEHINRSHFDPLSPGVNGSSSTNHLCNTLTAMQCPICARAFETSSDLELHVNIEHRDILSPGKPNTNDTAFPLSQSGSICPVCNISLDKMKSQEMEVHIESHFTKSPKSLNTDVDLEKEAQKLREQREFEMLRAQYGMDDQGNFREQSAAAMQRAVYAGEMSVADYYERQVGLRAAESHVNALKCWMCSSTNEHTEFCKDPFQGNKLNETFKTIYLKECQKDEDPNYRNVCKKLVMEVEGKEIIERRCHAEKTYGNPTQQECAYEPVSPATSTTNKIIYCQTCTGDGCNGASVFTPFVILLLAPIALVKILSL